MATLERIRKRSGLLITVIGIAMLGFILTDLLGSGNSILAGDAAVVGKINSRTIEITEFQREMAEYEELLKQNQQPNQPPQNFTSKQMADGVWDRMLREELLDEQYEALGIECTSSELYERLKSNPNVQNAPVFKDQVSGLFSEALFQQYVNGLKDNSGNDADAALAYEQWLNFEKGTVEDTKNRKYNSAIEKGLYYPKALARTEYLLNNASSTAKFAVLEYSSIADSIITVTDADIKKYYNAHKEDFEVEASRSFEFISFSIEASQKDKDVVVNELNDIKGPKIVEGDTIESFVSNDDDSTFALSLSDIPSYPAFYRESNIPAPLDSTMFDQEIGYIKGPYVDGDFYRLTKITDIQNLPDSVEARHILISYASANNGQGNQSRNFTQAKELADSLFAVVKADTAMFDSLAIVNSDDPGSGARGGKLDWFDDRRMVKPFSDFSFQNEVGDIAIVPSIYGFHIIEILGQGGSSKAIELVTISREVIASDETYDSIYNIASTFASSISNIEEFRARAEEKGYRVSPMGDIKEFDERILGIPGNNREIVKWSYKDETNVGDIELFNTTGEVSSYVVMILTGAQDEGDAAIENVEDQIRPLVIKEKKAEMLMSKIEGAMAEGKDINAVAAELGIQVKDQVTNFSGSAISGYGNEPKVVGVMGTAELNTVSQPIQGERGVYIVSVSNRVPASDLPDYTGEQTRLQNSVRPRVATEVFISLKDAAKIKDRRANFY